MGAWIGERRAVFIVSDSVPGKSEGHTALTDVTAERSLFKFLAVMLAVT